MRLIIIILSIFCFYNTSVSQSWPSVFVEDYDILDVVLQDNKTYFATKKHIVQVDSLDNETVLVETSGYTQSGRFWKQSDGWIYIGWKYVDGDVLRPIIVLSIWDGDFSVNKKIDLYDFDSINNIGVSYQSSDSIYVLAKGFSQHQIFRINIVGEVLETNNLDMTSLVDMELLDNGINLVIGRYALYTVNGSNVLNQTTFDEEVIDVKVYKGEERIEVLTKSKVHVFNYSLTETDFISLPQNERKPVACYTYEHNTYLIETVDDQSYISTFNSSGSISEEYIERPDIKYSDLYITNDIYHVWGRNNCIVGGGLLKGDTTKFQSEIPYIDLGLKDLRIDFEGVTTDTVYLNNGDTIYNEYVNYSWEFEVTNNGEDIIENYIVGSYNYSFSSPPFINFTSENPLEAGENRIHTGDFKVLNFTNQLPGFNVWIGLDHFDANCFDNIAYVSFPTSTYNKIIPEIIIYPNPVSDILTVSVPYTFSYRIFDINGNLIETQNDYQTQNIDVSELKPELYLIEIMVGEVRSMQKFIKM